jgi:hypothetical protein
VQSDQEVESRQSETLQSMYPILSTSQKLSVPGASTTCSKIKALPYQRRGTRTQEQKKFHSSGASKIHPARGREVGAVGRLAMASAVARFGLGLVMLAGSHLSGPISALTAVFSVATTVARRRRLYRHSTFLAILTSTASTLETCPKLSLDWGSI